jgi:peptide/nickel transport system substrate-binding protein
MPRRRAMIGTVVVVAGAMVMGVTTTASASGPLYGPTGPVSSVGTKIQGGTATFAEGPSAAPTYIFPFVPAQQCSTMNAGQLSYLLYRPLYWFGNNNSPTVDFNYSIGKKPVFSDNDKTVTITLNNWKWSDGEQVTSRDIEFWMDLMFNEKDNWCSYTPGYFPDNITSMSYPNASTVVFHLNKSYNPTWFLYNELSQVFPLPIAWDRTSLSAPAPSPSAANLPDTTAAGAKAVYNFLNKQAANTVSYGGSPIWSIVDGPWKLQSFTATGEVTFVPNADYSGSPKPTISKFVEVPFTDDEAMVNEIKSGGPSALSQAELPDEDLPQLSSIESLGYNATNFTSFSFSYFVLNQGNPTIGKVFDQLYFRQAFQHLIDQQGWVSHILGGYAVPTYGPVPLAPPNSFADATESSNPYPFSLSDAASILKAHGWANVGSGEVAYCAKPGSGMGECGAGVLKGQKLQFNLDYQSGSTITEEETTDLKSQAGQVGINLELTSHPFASVIEKAVDCGPHGAAKPSSSTCAWTAEDWGAGWVYAPDFEPTGESLFTTGSAADYEGYSSAKADSLIQATLTAPASQSQSALDAYENYIEEQVPVVFFPTATGNPNSASIVLTSKHLGGYTNNVYTNLTPETWYLTK